MPDYVFDIVFITITIVAFVATAVYLESCDSL
jgi:hypothetical protein